MPRKNALPEPSQLDRENQVMELRRLGLTWTEIAQQTGYSAHTGAIKAYKRVMERYQREPREDLQKIEVERLNKIQAVFMLKAMRDEDEKSAAIALRAIELRAKLLGLNEPTRIQQDVTTWTGDDSIDRAVRDLAALLTSNDADSTVESPMAESEGESEPTATSDELADLVDSIGARMGQDENGSGMAGVASDISAENSMGDNSQDVC